MDIFPYPYVNKKNICTLLTLKVRCKYLAEYIYKWYFYLCTNEFISQQHFINPYYIRYSPLYKRTYIYDTDNLKILYYKRHINYSIQLLQSEKLIQGITNYSILSNERICNSNNRLTYDWGIRNHIHFNSVSFTLNGSLVFSNNCNCIFGKRFVGSPNCK